MSGPVVAEEKAPVASRTARWWVRLQVGFGLAGGLVWIGGEIVGSKFVAGVGLGLVIAGLLLRFGRKAAAGLLLAALTLPGGVRAQPVDALQERGLLVLETSTGRFGAALLSSVPAAGHALLVAPEAGAVYVSAEAASAGLAHGILDALRRGVEPATAVRDLPGGTREPLHVAALGRGCATGSRAGPDAAAETTTRTVTDGSTCVLAFGTQVLRAGELARLLQGVERRSGGEALPERLARALAAVETAVGDTGFVRSAAMWVSGGADLRARATAEEDAARGEIRLQVADHPHPAARLDGELRLVRARELVDRAARAVARESYDQAVALADSALKVEPALPGAWLQRGRALLYAEEDEAAEASFRRMLELDPHTLRFLGDPAGPRVDERVIPYRPRLLLRLDVYRRAFFPDLEFGPTAADSASG